jgi:hypothetical protein
MSASSCLTRPPVANCAIICGVSASARQTTHRTRRSREGFRLRCYLPPTEDEPDVVCDYQIAGWHLYLIEDVERVEVTSSVFERRPYRRTDDDASITISFTA